MAFTQILGPQEGALSIKVPSDGTEIFGTTFGWLERNVPFHFDKIVVPFTAFLYLACKYNNLVPSRLPIWR